MYGLYADCINTLITSLACPCQFEGVRLGLGGQPWWLVTLARLGHPITGALSQWALETVVLGSVPGWRVAWQGAWGYFNSGGFAYHWPLHVCVGSVVAARTSLRVARV